MTKDTEALRQDDNPWIFRDSDERPRLLHLGQQFGEDWANGRVAKRVTEIGHRGDGWFNAILIEFEPGGKYPSFSQKEWAAVAQIGADQELSTRAVLRQAVRLYQLHHDRLKAGETFSWSGDEQRAKDFAGPLYAHPVDHVAGGEDLRKAAAKYADMGIDERAEAMADNCDGDPWELIGYFREKLRQSQARVDAANNAATGFAKKLAALKGPAA